MRRRPSGEQVDGTIEEYEAIIEARELSRQYVFSDAMFSENKAKICGVKLSGAKALCALEIECNPLKYIVVRPEINPTDSPKGRREVGSQVNCILEYINDDPNANPRGSPAHGPVSQHHQEVPARGRGRAEVQGAALAKQTWSVRGSSLLGCWRRRESHAKSDGP